MKSDRYLSISALFSIGALLTVAALARGAETAVGDIKDAFTLGAFVVSQIFTAGAVYGAVRADLKHAHEKADNARDAAKSAHQRIDDIYERMGERRR